MSRILCVDCEKVGVIEVRCFIVEVLNANDGEISAPISDRRITHERHYVAPVADETTAVA